MIRLVVLALLAAAGLGFGIFQWAEARERDDRLAQLSKELAAAREDLTKAKTDAEAARRDAASQADNIARLTAERDAARAKAKETGAATAASDGGTTPAASANAADGMKGIAKMFETEEGKKMMKSQMTMMTKMQYGDLARVLNLSPQDAEQVMALLSERAGAMAEESFKMMGGGNLDAAGAKAMAAKSEAVKKDYDARLKAILGDDKFKQVGEYEKTLGDRMMLVQFDQHFTGAGVPLQASQRDSLLSIMTDERKNSPPRDFDTTGLEPSKGIDMLGNDAAMERFFQQEQDYQQRVLRRATDALGPDQVNALQDAFKQAIEMQRFGFSMARQMFKPAGQSPNPPAPAAPQ